MHPLLRTGLIGLTTHAAHPNGPTPAQPPALRHAFDLHVDVGMSERIGHGDGELLEFTPITGGTIDGPMLHGTVAAFGGDWSTTRRGITTLEARYLLRAADGAMIDIVNRGVWREADGYFRTSPEFRTDAAPHRWLTSHVFVGHAADESPTRLLIRMFLVE